MATKLNSESPDALCRKVNAGSETLFLFCFFFFVLLESPGEVSSNVCSAAVLPDLFPVA